MTISLPDQEPRCRLRDLGLAPGLLPPGPLNTITDVPGVLVGHSSLIQGQGLEALRTGVTVVLPHSDNPFLIKVRASVHTFNGFGKAAGFEQVRELGRLESPIGLTNTGCVGLVSHALTAWTFARTPKVTSVNAVVGECNDGFLNNLRAQAITPGQVGQALDGATSGPPAEGNAGAGVGMVCFGFKGGVGTSSRMVQTKQGDYTLGVLVVANFGKRRLLTMDGIPVGRLLAPLEKQLPPPRFNGNDEGSIMIVLATDATLSSRQLGRLARRAPLGLARVGSQGEHGSGDFIVAFSTQHPEVEGHADKAIRFLPESDDSINTFFLAVVESVEEAVLNALCSAQTMQGFRDRIVHALPLAPVRGLIQAYAQTKSQIKAELA